MTAAERRLKRDRAAAHRLALGEPWEAVAARYGLSRVQLWRRLRDLRLSDPKPPNQDEAKR